MYMFLAESLWIFLAEEFVEMFARKRQLVRARQHERVVGYIYDAFERRHLRGVYRRGYDIAYKQQLCLAVIDDIVNLIGGELMEHRHCHGTVCQRGDECHCPVRAVTPANGYLVAFLHTAVFKHDMQFLYLTRHVLVLQSGSFIVCKGIEIPVVYNALF